MKDPKALLVDLSYIKLFRKLGNDGWLKRHTDCLLWMGLMMNAAHEPEDWILDGKIHHLKPGQWVGLIKDLIEMIEYSRYKINHALDRLAESKTIIKQDLNKGVLITLCNWDLYQGYNGVDLSSIEPRVEPAVSTVSETDTYQQYKGKYRSPMGGNLDNPIFHGMAEAGTKIIKAGLNSTALFMSQKVEAAWTDVNKRIMAELINGKSKEMGLSSPVGDIINQMCSCIVHDKQLLKKYGQKPWFVENDYPEIMINMIRIQPKEISDEQRNKEQARIKQQREEDQRSLEEALARRSKNA